MRIKEWFCIVTCKIVGIFVDENLLKDEKLDTKKYSPLIYKFKGYVTTSKRLGWLESENLNLILTLAKNFWMQI